MFGFHLVGAFEKHRIHSPKCSEQDIVAKLSVAAGDARDISY